MFLRREGEGFCKWLSFPSCPPGTAVLGQWNTSAHGELCDQLSLPQPQHPHCHEPGRSLQLGGPEAPDLQAHGQ